MNPSQILCTYKYKNFMHLAAFEHIISVTLKIKKSKHKIQSNQRMNKQRAKQMFFFFCRGQGENQLWNKTVHNSKQGRNSAFESATDFFTPDILPLGVTAHPQILFLYLEHLLCILKGEKLPVNTFLRKVKTKIDWS